MPEDYVPRPEWELYCRSVNGELKEIKKAQGDANAKLDGIRDCVANRWSRGQVVIVGFFATSTGSLLAILLTHVLQRH